jgi:leader peptidase (prepilin peptidase)/N-methyltransferase
MPTAATWYFFFPPHAWPAVCGAALLGLFIGSFLNVVICRLPKMMQRGNDNYLAGEQGLPLPHAEHYNLLLPRSHCPSCATPLLARHNITLLSYLYLRGRCAACRDPISPRYPLVELLAAALSALLIWHFGSGVRGLSALLLMYFLLAMAWIDAETGLLPDSLTLPLLWAGLLVNLNGLIVPLRDAVLGAAVGYLTLWLIFQLYRLASGRDGMGYGDFKLLAALGAWLGWSMLPLILLLASLTGLLVGGAMQLSGKRELGAMLPFGPFLAAGGLFGLCWGPSIWQSYLQWMLPA